MKSLENLRRCHICQEYGDHWTPRCPKLICAECDEKGHSKLVCPYLINDFLASSDNDEIAQEMSETEDFESNKMTESARSQSKGKQDELDCLATPTTDNLDDFIEHFHEEIEEKPKRRDN